MELLVKAIEKIAVQQEKCHSTEDAAFGKMLKKVVVRMTMTGARIIRITRAFSCCIGNISRVVIISVFVHADA